jgi:dsDNA-binding SOS-regulon protein
MIPAFIKSFFSSLWTLPTRRAREIATLYERMNHMAHTLDEVLSVVTAQTTKIDSLSELIAGLRQQVADALSGATLPQSVQSKVDAVFDDLEQNTAKIDTALATNTNTPPETQPPTE